MLEPEAGSRPAGWKGDLLLLVVALLAGVLFFTHLGDLWPLARIDVTADREALEARAREGLKARGLDTADFRAASRLVVDDAALDFLERSLIRELGPDGGRRRVQELIAGGLPVYEVEVHFKRRGDPDRLWATVHPEAGLLGWGRTLQEDAPGAVLSAEEARELVPPPFGPEPNGRPVAATENAWRERGAAEQVRPERVDHRFVYERVRPLGHVSAGTPSGIDPPELRERATVTVGGDRVVSVDRRVVVPEAARRATRARQAPVVALQVFGFLALGVLTAAAFAVFLTRLRSGVARLGSPVVWAAVVGVCFLVTEALQGASLLLAWDPLWPRWVSSLRLLGIAAAGGGVITLFLLVVISAGDALDREVAGGRRGASLWLAGRGRLAHPAVGRASVRGFLVGLLCGGVMTVAVLSLEAGVGAWAPLQPRGFFFYALNSDAPTVSTLLYFLMVALAEELGYRFFAGSWILGALRTPRVGAILAVLVPALVYGTTHTGLGFLPPEEPFWGRALVFTLVGCVWGWAFLRFDALTVVLSHWTADLFIFNWPRLASGEPAQVAAAVAAIAVPLVPAVAWGVGAGRRGRAVRQGTAGE